MTDSKSQSKVEADKKTIVQLNSSSEIQEVINQVMNKSLGKEPNLIMVNFNVGGVMYRVSLGKLLLYPDSLLGKMFTGTEPVRYYNDAVYIDQDGDMFKNIFEFLRNPNEDFLDIIDGKDIKAVRRCAKFYGLETEMFANYNPKDHQQDSSMSDVTRGIKNMYRKTGENSGGDSPTLPTPATFGANNKALYNPSQFPPAAPSEVIISTTSNHFKKKYAKEGALTNYLYPTLVSLLPPEDHANGIMLCNSENYSWLVDANDDNANDRKPDFVRIHKAFIKKGKSHGTPRNEPDKYVYGSVKNDDVSLRQVLTVFEGKVDNLEKDANLGIGINYLNLMDNLGISVPRVLMFNKYSILAMNFKNKTYKRGKWSSTSRDVVRDFVSGGEDVLTKALIEACKEFDVLCDLGGYLGKGLYGNCFAVRRPSNTSQVMVLKIILGTDDSRMDLSCDREYQNGVLATKTFPELVVGIEEKLYKSANGFNAIMYLSKGEPCKALSDTQLMFEVLRQLHLKGFTHGDARPANFVKFKASNEVKVKLIDYLTLREYIETTIKNDIVTLGLLTLKNFKKGEVMKLVHSYCDAMVDTSGNRDLVTEPLLSAIVEAAM